MKSKYFKNKVVIITGSRMGIGKTLAGMFGELNAKIVINARNAEKLEKTKVELEKKGYDVFAIPGDVSNAEDSKKLIEETIKKYEKLDILITNAGLSGKGLVEDCDIEVYKNLVDVNILGSVYPVKYALPYIKNTNGSIILISSLAGINGLPYFSAYSLSKMALTAFAESLKFELHKTKVHVGIAYVGFTENDPNKEVYNSKGELEVLPKRSNVKVQSAEQTAQCIINQIKRRKFKVIHTGIGKINWFFNKVCPKLIEIVIKNSMKKFE